ncbi:MAG: prephenate dehydratase [Phycisphaerales bacterium]|nr:MAG: prephenate dehydratase [Phycisphaerales bacterium]
MPPDQTAPNTPESRPPPLDDLRRRIDEIDRRLVELLNERASIVVDVGRSKRASGAPIYAPHREAAVLEKVLSASRGPLPARTIEAIYRELMSGSFALEQPLRIGYLGPQGSFSHQAAVLQFGSSVSFEDLHTIGGVFTEVRRAHVDYGLVPIENSTGGGIVETLDAFRESRAEATIYAEVLINIHHNLLGACEPRDVRRIHSKPEIFSQCRQWLTTQYPRAELIASPSSSRAVIDARSELDADPARGSAAIASLLAGQLHGLEPLFEKIEDNPNNITRFFVISRQRAELSGDDKTSIMFQTDDKPGALVRVLSVFDRAGVNLSHIDKRPSGRENWTYTFFIDAQGHRDDARVRGAIEEASAHCVDLIVLGSYPRAKRIL